MPTVERSAAWWGALEAEISLKENPILQISTSKCSTKCDFLPDKSS